MREILFRGKTINSEEWAEGNYLYDEFSGTSVIVPYINLAGDVTDFSEHSAAAVITETVGQYTGLTDKNGNKIFEGDIVRNDFYGIKKQLNGVMVSIIRLLRSLSLQRGITMNVKLSATFTTIRNCWEVLDNG